MKRTSILFITLGMLLSGGFYGCITEFEPKGIEEVRDLLIVDGTITDGTTTIVLRYSVGLTESLYGRETIDNATLFVETDAGDVFHGERKGLGTYEIPVGNLDAGKQYRLTINYDGEVYQSSFLSPLFTPEIDSLSYLKDGQGKPVYMCVNTHDPQNNSRYYRWSYRETWEVQSELYANVRIEDGEMIYHTPEDNTYYCWGRDSSKVLHLGSTEKLSENIISNKKLIEIEPSEDRLSVLYYLAVEQMQIRKEAYDYLSNLQKNIEQTGSIFTPMPSEMKGNIRCISNPSLPVIGYMEVATVTRKDRYYPQSMELYEPPREYCHYQTTTDPDLAFPIYAYYEFYPPETISFAPFKCVDCRERKNATRNKPVDWPNPGN